MAPDEPRAPGVSAALPPPPPGGSLPPPPPPPIRPDAGDGGPPPASWGLGEAFAGTIVAFVASQVLAAVILWPGRDDPCIAPQLLWVASLAGELALAAVVLIWVRTVSHAPLAALGLPRRPLGDVLTGLVGGVALIGIALIVSAVVVEVVSLVLGHAPKQPDQVPTCVVGGWLAALGPVVVLAAPLGEEAVFRGFLYRGLRRRFSVWPAALLSGALFGVIHVYPLLMLPLASVGVGLAFIYERRQSLLASMTAHAVFNLFGFILIYASR
jgi:membrane protease YdiL (CAAX protease family)